MSVSKQIDVLVIHYLTGHQALEFILGWLTMYFACILYNLDCTLSYTKISKTRFEYDKKTTL